MMYGTNYPATFWDFPPETSDSSPYSIRTRMEFTEADIARQVIAGNVAIARESAVRFALLRDSEPTMTEWEAGYEATRRA